MLTVSYRGRHVYNRGNQPRHLAAMFFDGSNLFKGHLVTISAELFSILTIGYREEDV